VLVRRDHWRGRQESGPQFADFHWLVPALSGLLHGFDVLRRRAGEEEIGGFGRRRNPGWRARGAWRDGQGLSCDL